MSKEWLSIPDMKSNTDTLGKQNKNYKTFYSCPKVSWEFVDSSPWPVLLPCPQSKMNSLTHSCSWEGGDLASCSGGYGLVWLQSDLHHPAGWAKSNGYSFMVQFNWIVCFRPITMEWRFASFLNLPSFPPSRDLKQHILPSGCDRINLTAKEIKFIVLT